MFIAIPSRYLIRNISPIVPLYNIKCALVYAEYVRDKF